MSFDEFLQALLALIRQAQGHQAHEALLTIKQSAAYCTCHPDTIRRAKATGALPYLKVGTTYRFKRADLDAWLAARR